MNTNIPKLVSFYWGGGPLSFLQYLSIASFKKHNPKWKVNLFMPLLADNVELTWKSSEQTTVYTGEDFLGKAKQLCNVILVDFEKHELAKPRHEVQKADILRWHILYEYGGIWSDIDILYTQPVDKLLDIGFDVALVYHDDPYIGFFIARPKQELFKDFYMIAKDNIRRNMDDTYQSLGAEMLRHRYGGFSGLQSTYPQTDIANLVMEVVYPYLPNEEIEEMFFGTKDRTTANTFGVHWYNGSDLAKKYQNNFEEYRKNKSIIGKLVKDYL